MMPLLVKSLALMIPLGLGPKPPAPLPSDEDVIARLRAVAGAHFRIRETDHFTIAYNTDFEVLRPLTGRLEGTYDAIWRFCRANDLVKVAPTERLEVIVFDLFEEYSRYAARVDVVADSMAGFYHPRTNVAVFLNMHNSPLLAALENEIARVKVQLRQAKADGFQNSAQREELMRTLTNLRARNKSFVRRFNRFVIQHEAAHQFLFNLGVHVRGAQNPVWLVEGLACQFEVAQSDQAGGLRQVNQLRLADFREALGVPIDAGRVVPASYVPTTANKRWLPLVDLIGREDLFAGRGDETVSRYAQAWALVYYLYHQHREPFQTYLRQLSTRRPGREIDRQEEVAVFESFFGKPDAGLERAWLNFTLKLRFDRRRAGR